MIMKIIKWIILFLLFENGRYWRCNKSIPKNYILNISLKFERTNNCHKIENRNYHFLIQDMNRVNRINLVGYSLELKLTPTEVGHNKPFFILKMILSNTEYWNYVFIEKV
jgi:hypothetical protein